MLRPRDKSSVRTILRRPIPLETYMFQTLVASTAPRQSRAGQLVTAVVVHAAIIAGAVTATESLSPYSSPAAPDTSLLFVASPPPTALPLEPRRPEAPALPGAPVLALPEQLEVAQPIPSAFNTSQAPAADWIRTLTTGDPVPTGTSAPDSGNRPTGEPLQPIETDRPPAPLELVAPRYPPALAQAGITGRVVAQFVVDTSGRVEPASIVILETAHSDFVAPVREALGRAAFRPGLFRGAPVRVLVRQSIAFRREDGRAGR